MIINVDNIKSNSGNLRISVYTPSNEFLSETDLYTYQIKKIEGNIQQLSFDLPDGNYAIAVHHDVNSNGSLDKNFIGIPKEPFGFSNNILPKFRAPLFEECMIDIQKGEVKKISLHLSNY
nr:DUF2141 domain-containing protein [Marinigracilibium pacificum]